MTIPDTLFSQAGSIMKGAKFFGITVGVAKAFEWFEDGVSEEGRRRLGLWLKNVPGDEQIYVWGNIFPNLIDRIFGRKALSWTFFLWSTVMSLFAVVISLETTVLFLRRFWLIEIGGHLVSTNGAYTDLFLFPAAALAINCLPDYFSVLISRWIVRSMAKRPTAMRVILLLLLDTIATLLMAYITFAVFTCILLMLMSGVSGSCIPVRILAIFRSTALNIRDLPEMRVFLFASLFTSIWVWLYVLSSVSIRILYRILSAWGEFFLFLTSRRNR